MKTLCTLFAALLLAACGGVADDPVTITEADGRQAIEQCYEDCGVGNNGYWVDSQVNVNFVPSGGGFLPYSLTIVPGVPYWPMAGGVLDNATIGIVFLGQPGGVPQIGVSGFTTPAGSLVIQYFNGGGTLIKQTVYTNFNGLPVRIKRFLLTDV